MLKWMSDSPKKIDISLQEMTQALKQGKILGITQNDKWYAKPDVVKWLGQTFPYLEFSLIDVAEKFIQLIDNNESTLIEFDDNGKKQTAHDYLEAAIAFAERLQEIPVERVKNTISLLNYRIIGLKYRLEEINFGKNPKQEPDRFYLDALMEKVKEWKSLFPLISHKQLSSKERMFLKVAACYESFVQMIFEDETLKNEFFLWTIRDQIAPSVFIQYPGITKKINESSLNGRIGRFGGNHLKIEKIIDSDNKLKKIVSLPFEGKNVNILNPHHSIELRGNYRLTIAEVFDIFANKNLYVGNLEYFYQGIINWNVHRLGWWNAHEECFQLIDLKKEKWWLQLPVLEIVSRSQLVKRYEINIDGKQWIVSPSASRGTATLDFDQSHAFLEVAIPQKNGRYAIYDFGKFATYFPKNRMDAACNLAKTVIAAISYPDENIYYSHRQLTRYSFALRESQAYALMKKIKLDILKYRQGNLVYQIESENCAKWVQLSIENILGYTSTPNLFIMSLLDTEPFGVVATIFEAIKTLPLQFQTKILVWAHIPMGALHGVWIEEKGKKIWKSLNNHPFWESGIVYLPAFLHRQKELGTLLLRYVEKSMKRLIKWNTKKSCFSFYKTLSRNFLMVEIFKLSVGPPRCLLQRLYCF